MRIGSVLIALVLITAGCGGGDGGTTTAAAGPTTTRASVATTAATTTTAAATTTMAVTTTTSDPLTLFVSGLARYSGSFEGEWVNTTFGSRGPIEASVTIDPETLTAGLRVDVGGFVFGSFDPDPETITVSLADVGLSGAGATLTGLTSATFGPVEITLAGDRVELVGGDVPDPAIVDIRMAGPLTEDGVEMSYVVGFPGGGSAEGTVTMERVAGEPSPPGTEATGPDPSVVAFLDGLAAAFREGDGAALLDALHPAVIDRYGAEQCRSYTDGLLIDDMGFEVLTVESADGWSYDQDELQTSVEDAVAVTAIREDLGQESELHLASVGGEWRWFTDCGDPN
jgi:hypothetical protein